MAAITSAMLDAWAAAATTRPGHAIATARLAETSLVKAVIAPCDEPWTFDLELAGPPPSLGDQGDSSNCCLFAATAEISITLGRRFGDKAFEISRPALFHCYVLETANCFLERMIDLADTPLDSLRLQTLLLRSGFAGMHRDMPINLVAKCATLVQRPC